MKSAPEPFAYIALLDCTVFEDSALFDSVLSRMDEARRAKVLALRSEKDRRTSLGAGYLAAFLLERYAENYVNRPAWMIRYGTDGRPVITDTDGTPAQVYLSLSHSGDHAMAGLSSSPVGVDLEVLAEPRYGIARNYYTKEENEYLNSCSDKKASFYEIWCKKECRIKRDGFADLRELPVLRAPDGTCFHEHDLEGYACFSYLTAGITPEVLRPVIAG